jgi:formate dehydrogenase major subunit
MVKDTLTRWPFIRQILSRGDGTGVEVMSARTCSLRPRHEGAEVARSVCPYCAVGCGQLVYHTDGKLVSIEGDLDSFISRWRLCPKGSDSFELLTHANQETRVKYRRPYSTKWEDLDLQTTMDMIADRLSSTVTRAEREN